MKTQPPNNIQLLRRLIPLATFPYLTSKGKPMNTYENIEHLLSYYKISVKFNLVSKKIEIIIPAKKYSTNNQCEAQFAEITSLCIKNEVPKTHLDSWLLFIADKNRYSPVVDWINEAPWDGTSRINSFLNTIESDNEELKRILVYRWMLGAVAAAFTQDGVALPGVLVLQGKQGIGKTQWFRSLIPTSHRNLIIDGVVLDTRNKDSIINCTGHWLVELGELDGTFNKSDMAALKSFLTKNKDCYRVPYGKLETTAPRSTAFFASVNSSQYLLDNTGNRRWWSITANKINWKHDLNMQQIWAEFKYIWERGVTYYLTEKEMQLLNNENALFEGVDPLEEMILSKFHWESEERNLKFTAMQVLQLLNFDLTHHNSITISRKCGMILAKLTGKKAHRSNGKNWFYLPRQSI